MAKIPTPGRRRGEWLLTAPSLLWLLVLFAIPTVLVFAVAFRPATPFGGIGDGWTLDSLRNLIQPAYPKILWRTLWLSLATTGICLLLAVPAAYWIARLPPARRQWMLLLIILPFWTNFLIRIFAWRTLLHPEGFVRSALVAAGLVGPDTQLLYNSGAVLLVMVYSYLPFAVLPVYAAAEKFNFSLLEAAQDLGATRLRAFVRVFLPGVRIGLITALLMVFIPSLGSYAIPDLVGGPTSEMIGNKIAQRVYSDRNLPHASGLSALLAMGVLLPMVAIVFLRGRGRTAGENIRERGAES